MRSQLVTAGAVLVSPTQPTAVQHNQGLGILLRLQRGLAGSSPIVPGKSRSLPRVPLDWLPESSLNVVPPVRACSSCLLSLLPPIPRAWLVEKSGLIDDVYFPGQQLDPDKMSSHPLIHVLSPTPLCHFWKQNSALARFGRAVWAVRASKKKVQSDIIKLANATVKCRTMEIGVGTDSNPSLFKTSIPTSMFLLWYHGSC